MAPAWHSDDIYRHMGPVYHLLKTQLLILYISFIYCHNQLEPFAFNFTFCLAYSYYTIMLWILQMPTTPQLHSSHRRYGFEKLHNKIIMALWCLTIRSQSLERNISLRWFIVINYINMFLMFITMLLTVPAELLNSYWRSSILRWPFWHHRSYRYSMVENAVTKLRFIFNTNKWMLW